MEIAMDRPHRFELDFCWQPNPNRREEFSRSVPPIGVEVENLAQRVNSRIGSAASVNSDGQAKDLRKP
jgi:hypothetical protein